MREKMKEVVIATLNILDGDMMKEFCWKNMRECC